MAGFLSKALKPKANKTFTPNGGGTEGPREYYPKTLGIHCVENPNVKRRELRPLVIGLPPEHRPSNIAFKDNNFQATQHWMGKLFMEPFLINIGHYPVDALYPGTNDKIIPNAKTAFDKPIPILTEETGIESPLTYELEAVVENELARLTEELHTKAKSEKAIAYLTSKIEALGKLDPTSKVRTAHDVKTTPKLFIPLLTTLVEEDEDFNKTFTPVIAIFEESITYKKLSSLAKNGLIEDANDLDGALNYLYGDLNEATGKPFQIFRNKLGAPDAQSAGPFAAKLFEGPIPKPLTPYFDLDETKFDIDIQKMLRIIVLEMIQLYAPKEDRSSLEGRLKNHFWSQVNKSEV